MCKDPEKYNEEKNLSYLNKMELTVIIDLVDKEI